MTTEPLADLLIKIEKDDRLWSGEEIAKIVRYNEETLATALGITEATLGFAEASPYEIEARVRAFRASLARSTST